jgi:hypothetical protein
MLKLFKYEGYKLEVDPKVLLIPQFKKIWDKDKTKGKVKALTDFTYIYFFCDPRSDYMCFSDESLRNKNILEDQGLPENWKPDSDLLDAIKYYNKFKTSAALLLEDTRIAVDKLRKLLTSIDLEERNEDGKPVYTINSITATIKQIPQLIQELDNAEKALAKDEAAESKMRGAGEKSLFDDGV